MTRRPLIVAFVLIAAGTWTSAEGPADDWHHMQPITPRGYVCHHAATVITIDGRLDEAAWAAAPWSQPFMDIEGPRKAAPRFQTRMKMLWDDKHLYIAAQLDEPHVWATITEKNKVIFYDNDFEVFIDPDGDHHHYYEFEMNALNTIWELTLIKPYRNGGPVNDPTNLPGLRSAVHVHGTLNDPSDTDTGWSLEIAIPFTALKPYHADPKAMPPDEGDQWRINFSRVEWLVDIIDGKYVKVPREARAEDNWVWSPQGVINMHCPERWGYVQFTRKSPGQATFTPDPTLPARDMLMGVYYLQQAHRAKHDKWAGSLYDLRLYHYHHPSLGEPITITVDENDGYEATAKASVAKDRIVTLRLTADSRITTALQPKDAER